MAKKKALTKKTISDILKEDDFRVAIFGSARIKPEDKIYKNVFALAKEIGVKNYHLLTGGGPGLMEAANAGHEAGDPKNISDNIGLLIELPWESKGNPHLEIKKEFNKFSRRLDTFMALSNVMVVMPGGIGTLLELAYTWQLIQVRHIHPIPIILVGEIWKTLIDWVKKYPLEMGLISPQDMDCIHVVKNNAEALKIIEKTHRTFEKDKIGNEGYMHKKK
jgi:uncharacterized protein (TIGR00730 family)